MIKNNIDEAVHTYFPDSIRFWTHYDSALKLRIIFNLDSR